MMTWEQLMSLKRQGDQHKRLRIEQDETRLGFEVDYDRIIFSSHFRSLQDKTQVIPLSKNSFVHTRLTHSLEVSVVGRSLGRSVGRALLQRHPHLSAIHAYQPNDFGAVVAAAALAHDIGNPPFGHSGEKAIGDFFKSGPGQVYAKDMTPAQYQDLCDFEGNANGFKMLTQTRDGVDGGLRLSYATLGAFMKYPKGSLPKKPTPHCADKKYGYFSGDQAFFEEVALELGLIKLDTGRFTRHPLAYLVEAADDICYTIIDFEDGINLGWISEDVALEFLLRLVKDSIQTDKYSKLTKSSDRLAYLRSLAISRLIQEASELFLSHEEVLLSGKLEQSLMSQSQFKAQINDILKVSKERVYEHPEVLRKELSGHRMLTDILTAYVTAALNTKNQSPRFFDQLLIQESGLEIDPQSTVYEVLMEASHFVSRLTDSNALALSSRLSGEVV
jgi:dGTPase